MLLVDDLETIFQINDRLNRAGIDTISCGSTVSWAFEAFERGIDHCRVEASGRSDRLVVDRHPVGPALCGPAKNGELNDRVH